MTDQTPVPADDSADSVDVFDLLERSGVDLDDPKWSGMDAFDVAEALSLNAEDPADSEVIETGPGFPVACASMHEHDPIACAPDLGVSAYPVAPWIVTVHTDDEQGDPDARAGSVLTTPDLDAFLSMLHSVGLVTNVDRRGDEITYASATCPTGYIRFRRPNPGEVGPTRSAERVDQDTTDAEDYRYLREILRDSMDDPDVWDGEEAEGWILGSYVKWLAAGRPLDEDGYPIRRESYPRPVPNRQAMRYRLAVLPASDATYFGVKDCARDEVLVGRFGVDGERWIKSKSTAERAVSDMNAKWSAAGGWDAGLYVDPDTWVTVDAQNGPERWDGRRWNRYVTDAEKNGNSINVRILAIG